MMRLIGCSIMANDMKSGPAKLKWMLNFSIAVVGGGLKRLEETAKWFDGHGGAVFLVNYRMMEHVLKYSVSNRYVGIRHSKVKRFFFDGSYLPDIIERSGVPDIYFSYGVPLFYGAGRINWLHITNALTMSPFGFNMPLKRTIEHWVLGGRLAKSMRYAQIASAESEFSLDLLRNAKGNMSFGCEYIVLENGCADELLGRGERAVTSEPGDYAITIGTAPYKQLTLVLEAFHKLQEDHRGMDRIKIIGDIGQIPETVLCDGAVEVIKSCTNEEVYDLLRGAKFYISASQIENSSVAALEGLLLAQNAVLSDIPSHREICRGLDVELMKTPGGGLFLLVDGNRNSCLIKPPSWSSVLLKMNDIATNYLRSMNACARG